MAVAAGLTATQTLSWAAIGSGFVVLVVVAVLLQLLLRAVDRIDVNVARLWQTATTVARNTATTWMLGETGNALDELKNEALRHDALLSGDGAASRSHVATERQGRSG